MNYLCFDIETIPRDLDEFDDSQMEYLLRNCESEEDRQEALDKLGLNPLTGRIACIGMLLIDSSGRASRSALSSGPAETHSEPEEWSDGTKWRCTSEEEMLKTWWRTLDHFKPHLISFNGRGFDAPYLMLKSACHRIRPTRNLMDGTKFNYRLHTDLAQELTWFNREWGFGALKNFNFDFYCRAFGLTSPKAAGVSGHMVPEMYAEGKHREIAEYCMRDVVATWELYSYWREYLAFS